MSAYKFKEFYAVNNEVMNRPTEDYRAATLI